MADEGIPRGYEINAVEVKPEEYYIEAEQSLVERPLRTLKRDDLFGVFDIDGDFGRVGKGPEGLYFLDTRFLSRMDMLIGGQRPLLLDSVVLEDNAALLVDLTNADLHGEDGGVRLTRGTIFVNRAKFLLGQHCYEGIGIRNYGDRHENVRIDLSFSADFADLFEVRGERRKQRGIVKAEVLSPTEVLLHYQGLDGVTRRTSVCFDPPPEELTERAASWTVPLAAGEKAGLGVTITCGIDTAQLPDKPPMLSAYRLLRRSIPQSSLVGSLSSSNALFNEVIQRAAYDLDMLLTDTGHGLYPYAGVPWYSTVFGRDGIISALLVLPQAPEVARGVLRTLAASQATMVDEAADAQPGKILHEMRAGEMAQLGEVPFRRYYGTVDATPLFVMLAGAYHARTGDKATIEALWPNIEAALNWIDTYGDPDGDGFVEYCRATEQGLSNQGWKDSHDAIFHADGLLAEGPITLCEVQGYVFAAKKAAAELSRVLGKADLAARLEDEAERLRRNFEEKFWIEDLGIYALALDGKKEPCRVRASNAGHALFTGIASPERAARIVEHLMGRDFFSGWGIRTVAAGEARYNPMSYHNGSVWPHDNALIALGFARYGFRKDATKVLEGLFAAATFDELRRLPELFCGFRRRQRRGPTAYPVACAPQAWAAATPFALVSACIGLDIDEAEECVRLDAPRLPSFIDMLTLPDIRVGGSSLSLCLQRHGTEDVTVAVTERSGPAQVLIMK